MGRFEIIEGSIPAVKVIQRRPIGDSRGSFERLFCAEELRELVSGRNIAQVNHSRTSKCGTIRGLHFQYPPHAEIKLVSCLRGGIYDVAVDLRAGSPTFLHWHAEILTGDNHKSLLIPEGFAHGFQTLAEECELLYFHTAAWRPDAEGGVNALDGRLHIRWPRTVAEISSRDAAHPLLTGDFAGVAV